MKYVKALSIDYHLDQMLQQPALTLSIHSIFRQTINILINDNLFTLAHQQLDNAPATAIIDVNDFSLFSFTTDDLIQVTDSKMMIGNQLVIDLESAELWKSVRPSFPTHTKRLEDNLRFAKDFIIAKGKADWLDEIHVNENLFYEEMGRMLREKSTRLLAGFPFEDLATKTTRAEGLLGLGQGLTPSGDDFLMGLMVAFATVEENVFNQKEWAKHVLEKAETKTNLISYQSLKYAERGEARARIGLFIQTLFTGNVRAVERDLKSIIDIGSSSGTDISWGIVRGLQLFL